MYGRRPQVARERQVGPAGLQLLSACFETYLCVSSAGCGCCQGESMAFFKLKESEAPVWFLLAKTNFTHSSCGLLVGIWATIVLGILPLYQSVWPPWVAVILFPLCHSVLLVPLYLMSDLKFFHFLAGVVCGRAMYRWMFIFSTYYLLWLQ